VFQRVDCGEGYGAFVGGRHRARVAVRRRPPSRGGTGDIYPRAVKPHPTHRGVAVARRGTCCRISQIPTQLHTTQVPCSA
jgi:hypothetical protein